MPSTPVEFPSDPLPIDGVLADILAVLSAGNAAVIVAPPGAGKTTRVPLALLDATWLGSGKVLVLEPRRLAARSAAERMASMLGQRLGQTVGLRARLATVVGDATRIEVVTEGVFTRMMLDDPMLDGIGAVLFDEFHERSLDAELGLALALETQRALRPDLRLVAMSATLDQAGVARLMGGAPVISCTGRQFPVETRYLGRSPATRLEDQMASAILKVLDAEEGSVLAFLPGQREIDRVEERLRQGITDESIEIAPLYGALDPAEQDRAIAPSRPERRKVVLATSIAETSLTIEGIRVVVDSGLSRVPRYEPGSGLTRLQTVRSSRAAIEQRRGRAGRLGPGVCYRLWSAPETQSLPAFDTPEIANADLSGLIMDCAAWGVADPGTLDWLDGPPPAALETARAELLALGALETDGRLSPNGKSAAKLPLPPRLAMMLLRAASAGRAQVAAEIAAVLVERGLGGFDTDLETRLSTFRSDRSRRARDMTRLAGQWARIAMHEMSGRQQGVPSAVSAAAILALAYPDRLAKARGATGQYLLANGLGAQLGEGDPLIRADYLVVADMTIAGANGRIRLAAAIEEAELRTLAGDRIQTSQELKFDSGTGAVRCRRVVRLDAIVLSSEPRPIDGGEEAQRVLCQGVVTLGIARLPWSTGQLQLRERVAFLRRNGAAILPDLSDAALSRTVDTWLVPFLAGKTALSHIGADDLGAALDSLVDWQLRQRIDAEAPSHYEAPTGTRHLIDYSGPLSPSVAIRVQELFGVRVHPTIGDSRVPLTLELLSPARRPIQITRDLAGFWVGSWKDVRSQLRGRYPKHFWPENAAEATPTTRTKSRMAD